MAEIHNNTMILDRKRLAGARAKQRAFDVALAHTLKEKGHSNVAIGEQMGIKESSVRSLLAADWKN